MKKIIILFVVALSFAKGVVAQNVGIGTATPNAYSKLHVHDELASQDASISLTINLTGTAALRGGRFRFLNSDLNITNYEATGKIQLSTSFNVRMTVDAAGNVGINVLSPAHKLDIANSNNTRAINIAHTGNNTEGIYINMGNSPNNKGVYINSGYNYTPGTISLGLHAISGNGALANYSPTVNYGVVGECRNPSLGGGVLGISNAPSPGIFEGGVTGNNFSAAAEAYGVVGVTSSVDGAGVVGKTSNASTGVLGYSVLASWPAIKAQCIGTSGTAIELNNGAIKVSGTERAVFQHITNGANIVGNLTIIPASTLANSATDMLVVTSVYDASNPVYITFAFQTYWNGANWCIINPTGGAMPVNAKFNVLVVKQ